MADIQKEKSTRKLTCIVTGKPLTINKEYWDKKVLEAGGEQEMVSTYCCKQAKSMIRRSYSIDEIRKVLGTTTTKLISDEIVAKIRGEGEVEQTQQPNQPNTKNSVLEFIERLKQYA